MGKKLTMNKLKKLKAHFDCLPENTYITPPTKERIKIINKLFKPLHRESIHKMCEECKNNCKKEVFCGNKMVACAKFEEKVYGVK